MREGGRLEQLQDRGGELLGAAARIAGNLHVGERAVCTPGQLKVEYRHDAALRGRSLSPTWPRILTPVTLRGS
jgi:hypothetical protein